MTATIAEAIRSGADRLVGTAENPRHEARLLLAHALGLTRNDLIRDPERRIDTAAFEALLIRRAAYEPVAHLLCRREFWSLDFLVSPSTLIPRPDSETLIEAALAVFSQRNPPRGILDLGTGTGCLLLALLHEYKDASGIGVDLSPDAVRLARINAQRLGLDGRAAFAAANWTACLSGRFDLVISNPPYIPAGDIIGLMPEVALYEPRQALDGGPDGYDAYRAIIGDLRHRLSPGGVAILELGAGQAAGVATLARCAGFSASLHLDLAQIPRAIVLSAVAG